MSEIIAAAKSQLESLEAKRAKLLQIIEIAESLDNPDSLEIQMLGPPSVKQTAEGRPSPVSTATYEAVRSILRKRGRPIRLGELVVGVVDHGVSVGGKDPASTLSARLSNSKEFESHRGLGWWFAGEPLPDSLSIFEEAESPPSKEELSASNPKGQHSDEAALG